MASSQGVADPLRPLVATGLGSRVRPWLRLFEHRSFFIMTCSRWRSATPRRHRTAVVKRTANDEIYLLS